MFELKCVFVNKNTFSVSGCFLDVQFQSKKRNIYELKMSHDLNPDLSPTKIFYQ